MEGRSQIIRCIKTVIYVNSMEDQLFCKCTKCGVVHEFKKFRENFCVCNTCKHNEILPYDLRIQYLVDEDTFEEFDSKLSFTDPIFFPEYQEKYNKSVLKTNMKEAVITGCARVGGFKVMLGIMDSRFMMGSMGIIVGEKITRLFEEAGKDNTPVILFTASGGARMQEGIFSLMQMAKTTSSLAKYREEGGLFISYLTHPTTGGVSASFALLGDINIAEPKAVIGFTGKRVVEQTIKENIPSDFQTSEYMMEHGYLDAIVERKDMRNYLIQILKIHDVKHLNKSEFIPYEDIAEREWVKLAVKKLKNDKDIKSVEACDSKQIVENDVWQKVLLTRNMKRFRSLDIIHGIFHSFIELHGDRCLGDDKSMVCGLAWFEHIPVTIISQQKGKDEEEMKYRQYGMSMPEGYRKSLRLMKQAEKFHRPIICFIDTPGAFPGIIAEEHGQAEAIGRNLYEMSKLKVPVISIVLGEGGSGGALALGVANYLMMMENSIYSVVSPEGCASILWKNSKLANKAAQNLRITAEDIYRYGIADEIIPESNSFSLLCSNISRSIRNSLEKYSSLSEKEIIESKRIKYRMFDYSYHSDEKEWKNLEA